MIRRLLLENFRCHSLLELNDLPNVVLLTGNNGVGKTSVLEAISLFGLGRGLRGDSVKEAQKFGAQRTKVFANLVGAEECSLAYEHDVYARRRKNYIDEKYIRSSNEFLSKLRVIWLTPEMDRMLDAPRVERRKWLDRLVYNIHPEHAVDVLHYEQLLSKRMKMLKSGKPDPRWLDQIEIMLAKFAHTIATRREGYMRQLTSFVAELTDWPKIHVELQYEIKPEDEYAELLKTYREKDLLSQRSNFGCHKAELLVLREGVAAGYLSTGQLKSALIHITIAHYNLLASVGVAPILLLDDIFSHFDDHLRGKLEELIASHSTNQFWITATAAQPQRIANSIEIRIS